MANYLKIFICWIFLIISQQVSAQIKQSSSLNAGAVIPIGKLADFHSTGLELGIKLLSASNNNVMFTIGLLYSYYPGSKYEAMIYSYTPSEGVSLTPEMKSYENSSILKLFLGPQTGYRQFYLLPNLSVNFSGRDFRLGLDGIIGCQFPVSTKSYLDFSIRYELQNLIGRNEGEYYITAFHIGIGIGVKY